jgi:hypothetical protein
MINIAVRDLTLLGGSAPTGGTMEKMQFDPARRI